MAQDFLGSGMIFPPQINPATGRFEVAEDETKIKEWNYPVSVKTNSEAVRRSEPGSSYTNDSLMDGYKMDSREAEDIQKQIRTLAKSYVPEWKFDIANPDIGSVLALIYAGQTEKNIKIFNHMLEQYCSELVKLVDISPMPAHPAQTTVLVEATNEAEEGMLLPKSSKFQTKSEDNVIFETAFPIYLTPAKLRAIFMTSAKNGRILPIMGEFKRKNYIDLEEKIVVSEAEKEIKPFSLFQFAQEGLERQAVVFYHSFVFDVEEETIDCRIEAQSEVIKGIEDGEFRFLYYTKEGFLPIESYRVMGNHILLDKAKPNQPVIIGEKSYSVFVLEAKKTQKDKLVINSIDFSTVGSPVNVRYAGNGMIDYEVEQFSLFGDKLDLESECYIGEDHYFSKKGSRIYLKFHGSFEERYFGSVRPEETGGLKLIKRKPRKDTQVQTSYVFAQEISIEYYNGIGWKRIECDKDYRHIFRSAQEDDFELSFLCPKDWKKVRTGAYHGRALRISLLRADHYDMQPCIHKIPVLSNFKVSYSYEEYREVPEAGNVFSGTGIENITEKLQNGIPFTAFGAGNYEDTSLYLGFDRKFVHGPVSLWWQLEGIQNKRKFKFYYSSAQGFKELEVIDDTSNLTHSGLIRFVPPTDMDFMELEGQRCCWIRVTEEKSRENLQNIKIRQIVPNGVTVYNIDTLEVQEFYQEENRTKLLFPLGKEGILDAEVWVNEKKEFSQECMERMAEEMPYKVRIRKNYLGEIIEFFVKWEETKHLQNSGAEDRHYFIDRRNGNLLFGNSMQKKFPGKTQEAAFKVQLRCCNGKKGNVEAGTIIENRDLDNRIWNIRNPLPAFGGSDMEAAEKMLQRGKSVLVSGNRLVTQQDYEKEVLFFSDNIDKAAVINGVGKDGSYQEGMLYIVPLMKDYMKGKDSFFRIQNELKQHLLQNCELSIDPEELQIQEPLFVDLNVEVWAAVSNVEESFEIQNLAQRTIENYLNPVSDSRSKGWDIGVLPGKSQILMRLNSLGNRAKIRHIMVTVKYEDENGIHEADIDDIKVSPFMVVKNGIHHIHISSMEEKRN